MTNRTISIEDSLNAEATAVLDSIGLNLSMYVELALRQLVNEGKVPFELKASSRIPTEQTWRRMIEVEAKESGLLSDDAVTFDDPVEAVAELHKASRQA
ncbi:type II toxin-antitoxin system RelB/DinJ family antitoxin [Bifidobacterium crudilactis]|uniref:type II toxin-antitoxin system RelB/DinJ family antitoxin n=1 Tax=Bifidobacterium crudilactis TaxID=327277 RepID=UPI002353AD07|nr:type II toxin-antitoxin system RelB/DinJ family antitoxin [Bifidobacterium crudilactis]MCI2148200.1 type II toxin-antitoxin system RelB/DinJ family antitoxin [Bifidobacterium crudilactis]MCI2157891.1 type II toxin-antitoxin system RelB/DinJ family antitoxin [Bifidobacterium crudilactis]